MKKRLFLAVISIALLVSVQKVSLSEELVRENEQYSMGQLANKQKVTPYDTYGRLSVSGTTLVGENGKIFQMKGVSTHGINWFPQYVNKKTFQSLRDQWAVNTVRLAMYTEEYNGYCSGGNQKELRSLVCSGVDELTELGMYAIVDWHILNDGNPNSHVKEAKAFFKTMAKKYKNQDNVIYEICNEPNGGTDWSQIRSYAKKIIPVIRKQDSDAIVVVGTPTWSQELDKAVAKPLDQYENIMYTLHFYSGTHKKSYRNLAQNALEAGLPVMVTEFSITGASGNGDVDKKEANKWIKLLRKYHTGYVIWNLSNKNEDSAMIRSDCDKLSGWSKKQLKAEGVWYKNLKT